MATDAYELDPDVAVIRRRMPVSVPKSAMYGKNPELQPDAEYSYETDPDITSISNRKVTPAEKPEPGSYLPLFLKGVIIAGIEPKNFMSFIIYLQRRKFLSCF